jgi:hypothetical protein
MNFEPWTPQREPKPYAFITDANASLLEIRHEYGTKRYTTVRGGTSWLERMANNVVLYSLVDAKRLVLFGGAQNWTVIKYHERPKRAIYRGHIPIHCFAEIGSDPQALVPFFDALKELGIGPASLSTMGLNSWRRLLPRTYRILEWQIPGGSGPIGRAAFHGGRKEAIKPGVYSGVQYLDLPAAYLQAMRDPIPMYLREEKDAQWCDEGIAEAIVSIPRQSWNPLPFRIGGGRRGIDLAVYAYGKKQRGIFVISELRNAVKNHGVDYELVRVWKGYKFKEPFKEWLPWALELRSLPGASGVAAKQMTTRLWSLFAQNPGKYSKVEVTFEDAKGKRRNYQRIPGRSVISLEKTVFVSAIIASRVRQRLLEELIPAGAIQVDTDGGIVPRGVLVPGWAQKRVMDTVEIRSSQAYRWQCPDCPNCLGRHRDSPWHYSVAGMPSDGPYVPDIFERMPANKLLRMKSFAAIAIPAQPVEEAREWINSAEIEALPDESL